MKKKKKLLDTLYEYDKRNNSYKIAISLDKYEDIYNEWDPNPFKKRDIEEEFIDYVKESASDIPMKYGIDLDLYLPEALKDETKEKNAKQAIKNYFNYLYAKNRRSLKNSIIRCCRSFIIGIILIAIWSFYSLPSMISEGISIFGWVALWDVGEQFFFYLISLLSEKQALRRLMNAKVEFIYK